MPGVLLPPFSTSGPECGRWLGVPPRGAEQCGSYSLDSPSARRGIRGPCCQRGEDSRHGLAIPGTVGRRLLAGVFQSASGLLGYLVGLPGIAGSPRAPRLPGARTRLDCQGVAGRRRVLVALAWPVDAVLLDCGAERFAPGMELDSEDKQLGRAYLSRPDSALGCPSGASWVR
jgi:hypothetical protein